MEDERELVRLVLAGDPASQERFVLLFRPRLYAVAVAVLGYRDPEAEDAVQETFEAALKGLKGFEFRSGLYTWLNQICARNCYKRIRARRGRLLMGAQELAEAFHLPAPGEDAPLMLEREQRLAWLRGALGRLGKACGDLVRGRDLEGRSYAELAKKFKIAMGTVMSRLARCREKLKSMALKAEG